MTKQAIEDEIKSETIKQKQFIFSLPCDSPIEDFDFFINDLGGDLNKSLECWALLYRRSADQIDELVAELKTIKKSKITMEIKEITDADSDTHYVISVGGPEKQLERLAKKELIFDINQKFDEDEFEDENENTEEPTAVVDKALQN